MFSCYIMAMACILRPVCVLSQRPRQRGSQERYQSPWPPCEMSSRSRRLWDCCLCPDSLWMSASLTGQFGGYMAPLTTQSHFQVVRHQPASPTTRTAPLSGKEANRQELFKYFLKLNWGKSRSLPCFQRKTSGQCILFHLLSFLDKT